jgi:hypothetical protein
MIFEARKYVNFLANSLKIIYVSSKKMRRCNNFLRVAMQDMNAYDSE